MLCVAYGTNVHPIIKFTQKDRRQIKKKKTITCAHQHNSATRITTTKKKTNFQFKNLYALTIIIIMI